GSAAPSTQGGIVVCLDSSCWWAKPSFEIFACDEQRGDGTAFRHIIARQQQVQFGKFPRHHFQRFRFVAGATLRIQVFRKDDLRLVRHVGGQQRQRGQQRE